MREAYERVIDILTGEIDHKAMCIAFAKRYPKEFCQVVGIDPIQAKQTELERKIIDFYTVGKKVEAIKLHRQETGSGLKESKDFCDLLFDRHIHTPKTTTPDPTW